MRSDPSEPIILDLRGVPVRPERILEIARSTRAKVRAAAKPAAVAVAWGERFPWSTDARLGANAYPESLVSALADATARDGELILMALRRPLPACYTAVPAYRRLNHEARRPDGEWRGALRKLVSDLVDDAVSLQPQLSGIVALRCRADGRRGRDAAWSELPGECERRGLSFRAVDEPTGSPDALSDAANRPARHPFDLFDPTAELCGGIEERVVGQRLVDDSSGIPDLHERLRSWRAEAWLLVAGVHERITAAGASPLALHDEGVGALGRLRAHLSAFSDVRDAFVAGYAERADPVELRDHLRLVEAGVREQCGALGARLSSLRSLR